MSDKEETNSVEQRVYDAISFGSDGKSLSTDETTARSRALICSLIDILLTKQILTNAEVDNLLFHLRRKAVFNVDKKSKLPEGEIGDLSTNGSKRKPELPPSPEHAF